jgi:hypothetical protein
MLMNICVWGGEWRGGVDIKVDKMKSGGKEKRNGKGKGE